MSFQVLIAHSNPKSAKFLIDCFSEWGDQVWLASTVTEAEATLAQQQPELVVFNLSLLKNGWQALPENIQQHYPRTKILFTSDYPDPQNETLAKEKYGARVFLRQPVTKKTLEQALQNLDEGDSSQTGSEETSKQPKVRVPVRMKITLPYVVLALVLSIAAAYVVSQVVLDTIEERFTNQLIEAGKLVNDWMVNEEDRLLETLRLVAFTQGLPDAVTAGDAEGLREYALPLAVNYQEEAIEILDTQGVSLLSLRHVAGGNAEEYNATRGETVFRDWPFVQNVLNEKIEEGRDKYAGLARTAWGNYLYVAGPVFDENGAMVGVVLVGKSLPTLVRQIRQDTLAQTTIYNFDGETLVSTLPEPREEAAPLTPALIDDVLEQQDDNSFTRPLGAAGIEYSEILGPWEVREFLSASTRTNNDLGVLGVSLAQTFLARPSQITRAQIFMLTVAAFGLIILLGIFVARRITAPLLNVVSASAQVAEGNLDVQVDASGNDEVAVLAHSFNEMVSGLREGSIYRDLLGRTVSPQVREQLRQGFASGDVRLAGQEAVAAVLICDIAGFTTLSEAETPETILNWLNEYFAELVPIITDNEGVVSKFEGDSVLAFFGILPQPTTPQESAYRACKTALEMIGAVNRLNARRVSRGDSPFSAGIGISTGPVVAGGLGSTDRIHYTIIGDTVNTTARLEGLTRQFGENSIVVSQHTLFALQERRHEFELLPMGVHTIKGKEEQLLVYQLKAGKGTTG